MKDTIEMAREAGLLTWLKPPEDVIERFKAFEALVRADERAALMQLFTDPENQPTQFGTVTAEYMQREILAEREACAKLCDAFQSRNVGMQPAECAGAIRVKGNT